MDIELRKNIYEQGNRIYGIMEEIDQVSQCQDSQKLEKLNHIRDELNRIYEQSIALPEFLAQTKNKNQEGYEVIPRILTAWDHVQEKLSQVRQNLFGYSKMANFNTSTAVTTSSTEVTKAAIQSNLAMVSSVHKYLCPILI